jgi:hypothetical protein
MKNIIAFILLLSLTHVGAAPILQMNKAFNALTELLPLLLSSEKFQDKKNEGMIKEKIQTIEEAFREAKHDPLIKHDLFAPSYALITDNLSESKSSFEKGHKDYTKWLVKETISVCLDCHTRIPSDHISSFQSGELLIKEDQLKEPYLLGLASLIVRRNVDAKNHFLRQIQDKIISKDSNDMILPFQQILLIETKVMKDPQAMIALIDDFKAKKNLPAFVVEELQNWRLRLVEWKNEKALKETPASDKVMVSFIQRHLKPLMKKSFSDANKVDLLFSSGVLSSFLFLNPSSKLAPEISYWTGWIEKRLKRENFMSSGDLFLEQCIRKYPNSPFAQDCFKELEESIEFDFSGSSGTFIPDDVKAELQELKSLIERNKNKKSSK